MSGLQLHIRPNSLLQASSSTPCRAAAFLRATALRRVRTFAAAIASHDRSLPDSLRFMGRSLRPGGRHLIRCRSLITVDSSVHATCTWPSPGSTDNFTRGQGSSLQARQGVSAIQRPREPFHNVPLVASRRNLRRSTAVLANMSSSFFRLAGASRDSSAILTISAS